MTAQERVDSISGDDWKKGKTKISDFLEVLSAVAAENDFDMKKKEDVKKMRTIAMGLVRDKIERDKAS